MSGRIVEIEWATPSIPLAEPVQAGDLRIDSRQYCCLRVRLESGAAGEAFVMTRGLDVGGALESLFAGPALGGGPDELEAVRSGVRNIGWDGAISRAAAVLRLAALDARAREGDLPVWAELGAAAAPSCTAVVVIGYSKPGEDPRRADVEAATRAVEAGARCLKLMAGPGGPAIELERLAAVRGAIGSVADLILDVNGAWTMSDAHAALPRLAAAGLAIVEEPWPYEHGLAGFDGLPEERPELAFGEISASVIELEALARTGLVKYVRADATLLGGVEAYRELMPALRDAGATLFPHFWPELHSHLVALAPHDYLLECSAPGADEFALRDLLAPGIEIDDGRIVASSGPGFGFALDWEQIDHHAVAPRLRLTG